MNYYSVDHLILIRLIRISGHFKAISISLPLYNAITGLDNSKTLLFHRYFHPPQLRIKWTTCTNVFFCRAPLERTELQDAAEKGEVERVQRLLSTGSVSINSRTVIVSGVELTLT